MQCIVCRDEKKTSPYRCPQCKSPYCSVICYKQHKLGCSTLPQTEQAESNNGSGTMVPSSDDSEFSRIHANPRIQELLRCEGVSKYLRVVADILHDPKVSGEHTDEGRRIVALKKLRELRKGGREANEAIEELATTVVKLTNSDSKTVEPLTEKDAE